MTSKVCRDCRDGEHGNYDEDVCLVVVREPDTGRLIKRTYLCAELREMYINDGYDVTSSYNK